MMVVAQRWVGVSGDGVVDGVVVIAMWVSWVGVVIVAVMVVGGVLGDHGCGW
jgi:hypothetical protein